MKVVYYILICCLIGLVGCSKSESCDCITVVSCDGVITAFISNSYTSEEGHNVSQEFCNDRDAESHVYPATPYGDHCPNQVTSTESSCVLN